jgi:hypothetical protein
MTMLGARLWVLVCGVTFCITACTSADTPPSLAWTGYLSSPDPHTYRVLATRLQQCQSDACKQTNAPTSAQVRSLEILISKNGEQAADIGFLTLPLVDGGNLEDLMRALAVIADKKPDLLLGMFAKHRFSEERISALVRMLPLESVDDVAKRQLLVEHRIATLSSVERPNLASVRDASVRSLAAYLEDLKKR